VTRSFQVPGPPLGKSCGPRPRFLLLNMNTQLSISRMEVAPNAAYGAIKNSAMKPRALSARIGSGLNPRRKR
jgi:hypothetical protein